jgi:hypothetical protein
MSEIILQRSLSASYAVAARVVSSGLASPSIGEKKRIHFNEQVEQCIALEVKGDDYEEPDSDAVHNSDDSDSDDGAVMMTRINSKRRLPPMSSRRATLQTSFSGDSKTIAMLPSTTLKYGESPETAMEHGSGFYNSFKLSPSPPQGIFRPTSPILHRDDIGEEDANMDRQPPSLNSGLPGTDLCMFMPYEEDEDKVVSESLFEKLINTIDAAKDIAYIIWNVG